MGDASYYASRRNCANRQILVVEDHPETAEMLQLMLSEEGYQVEWAPSSSSAFDILSTSPALRLPPDLVLLDLTMPGRDPVEMVQSLPSGFAPPVILLSGQTWAAIEHAAQSLGAAAVLRKPFDIDDLLMSVRRVLESN